MTVTRGLWDVSYELPTLSGGATVAVYASDQADAEEKARGIIGHGNLTGSVLRHPMPEESE